MTAVQFKDQSDVTDVAVFKDTARIDLWYPRNNEVKFIKIGLMDVRAADGIRVHYDFERDGFAICQPKPILTKLEDSSYDSDEEWIEVAFCQSWKYGYKTPDGMPSQEDWEKADKDYELKGK